MSYHILYEACPWHVRCALFDENGRLLTLRFDDVNRKLVEGAVVWGRVRAVEPSLGGAFVDIGDVQDGFLNLNTLPQGSKLTSGQAVVVRIARAGFGGKGARLDGRTAVLPPAADSSCPQILKPAASALVRALHDANNHPVTVWILNAHVREAVCKVVPERSVRQLDQTLVQADDAPDWLERLDSALDAMAATPAVFPFAAGTLIVEMTSAVATIDVNAGPMPGASKQDATLAANLAAAEEVSRLCRLLDLGGSVIVDFITPKSKAQREMVADHLQASLQTTDDKFLEIRPMSRHGLLELTRQREGPSLNLLLKTPSFVAGRIGLELWRTPAGKQPALRRQQVLVNPQVADILKPQLAQNVCLGHLGRQVDVQADGALDIGRWKVQG